MTTFDELWQQVDEQTREATPIETADLWGLLADFGQAFNWITPIATLIDDWRYGPPYRFFAPMGQGFSGGDMERVLMDGGLRVWGQAVINRCFTVTVNVKHAAYAAMLLQKAGIPA
jgi:hypothetical protein